MKYRLRSSLRLCPLETRVVPAIFTVLNLNDNGADSLRDCISKANAAAGADIIDFKSGLTGTIVLSTGEMAISQEVAIIGPGSSKLSVSGNNASRIFNTVTAPAGTPIAISGLTLTSGNSTNSSGGAIVTGDEKITLTQCVLSGNTAKFSSGAVHSANGSTLIATNCSFTGNTAGAFGGALDIFGTGSKTILKACTLTGNSGTSGGALYGANYVLIEDCLIAGNTATTYLGGGVRLDGTGAAGTLTVRNSTISGNTAKTGGGGIALSSFAGPFNGTLVVQNSTITNNTSTTGTVGGGIGRPSGTGSIQIESTIVSGNIGISPDVSSSGIVNVKNSAIGSGTGFTKTDQGGNLPFQAHANLKLGTLADNGGPTQTHMLLPGSPCVDVGSNPASLAFDQRGFKRDFNSAVDMGAFEVNPQTFVVDQPTDENDGNFAKGDLSLREALALTNGFANTADTITFDTIAFQVAGQTILTLGQLVVTAPVDITWPNTFPLTINANGASRVIGVDGASTGTKINLTGLRLTGGKATGDGGAILGGDENLTLVKCVMTGNSASSGGGAVSMNGDGILTATDCQFTNNTSGGTGGAVEMYGKAATTTLMQCTISGNVSAQSGGVYAQNELIIDGCAIFGNTTTNDVGGGVFIREGPATIRNSTISGNTAKNFGGGIALFYDFTGTLVVQNCTITNNAAGVNGGGVFRGGNKATIDLTSTIVSGNTAPQFPDIRSDGLVNVNFSAIGNSSGFTLTGANNLPFGTDLKLGPLQLNGGSTATHAILAGSPLVDKGANVASLLGDQRGGAYKRAVGSAPDIGAYELAKVSLVTNTNDSGPGSLRQAAFDADQNANTAGLIRFDPTVFSTPQTITLTTGPISLFYFVEVQGPGAGLVTISGNNNSSHFFVGGTFVASDAIFSGLTLTNGKGSHGGAISGTGQSTIIRDCVLTGNTATVGGGAISINTGKLVMERTTVANNTATKYGGGLYFFSRSAFTITDSTISGNSVTNGQGGGLYFFNAAYAPAILRNSTVSGNTSTLQGGGIALNFRGNLVVQNSTITKNASQNFGGGIARFGGQGTLTLQSTIVAQNTGLSGVDINFNSATTITCDNSIIGVADQGNFTLVGANNQTGKVGTPLDAKLSPLANNGGPTLTHAPLSDSPAIDKGSNPTGLSNDQRGSGFPRTLGAAPDVGAFEVDFSIVVLNTNDSGLGSLRQAIINANNKAGLDSIAFDPSVFNASAPQTITLSPASGQLLITDDVIINGPGSSILTVSGGGGVRVFNISNATQIVNATFKGMTITGGNGTSDGKTASDGGGISVGSDEILTLDRVVVANNSCLAGDGGGIANSSNGTIAILNSTISGNTANDGGGIYFFSGGSLLLQNSTVSGNVSNGTTGGGGIYFFGTVSAGGFTIQNSTIAGNTAAASGGGLVFAAINTATAPIVIRNSTITGNKSSTTSVVAGAGGGGLAITSLSSNSGATAVLNLDSTILSNNLASAANGRSDLATIAAASTTINFSAVGDPDGFTMAGGSNNLPFGAKLNLLPLDQYGGPTKTVALGLGSAAFNAGSNPANLATDQRGPGFARSDAGAPDIGAFEGVLDLPSATAGPLPNLTVAGGTSYDFTVTYSGATAINVATLDGNDILVSGPGGFTQLAQFVSVDVNTNGSPRTATYRLTPPGGIFDAADNGAFAITLQTGQVTNTSGKSAPAITLGTFNVAIAATFTVTNLSDSGPGSLRQAILDSNASVDAADTIVFQNGLNGTMTLASTLSISDGVTVIGPGATKISVSGGGSVRPFTINGPGVLDVTISGLTITGGNSAADGGGINFANENLTLDGVVVTGNSATGTAAGGGISDTGQGNLIVRNSTISGNSAGDDGGGIYFFAGGSLLLENSTVSGNTAGGGAGGGGIYFFGTVAAGGFTIQNCTIAGNTAPNGGGLVLQFITTTAAPILIQNCTITGNVSTTTSSTIGFGGGGVALTSADTATISFVSTIVSGNMSTSPNGSSDLSFPATATVIANFCAIGDPDGFTLSATSGDNLAFGTDLKLGPLADNGGPTLTHALLAGSPAIDKGSNPAMLSTDQRGIGFPRMVGSAADIGAFEFAPPTPVTVASVQVNDGSAQRSRVTSLQVTFNAQVTFAGVVAAAFSLSRNGGGAVGGFTATANVVGGVTVVTISAFTGAETQNGSLADGLYTLTVFANQILNFDGDGNGTPGDNFVLVGNTATNKLFRLFGDADGNGTVSASDFNAFRLVYGTSGPTIFDFDNDGQVSASDFNQFRLRYGMSI